MTRPARSMRSGCVDPTRMLPPDNTTPIRLHHRQPTDAFPTNVDSARHGNVAEDEHWGQIGRRGVRRPIEQAGRLTKRTGHACCARCCEIRDIGRALDAAPGIGRASLMRYRRGNPGSPMVSGTALLKRRGAGAPGTRGTVRSVSRWQSRHSQHGREDPPYVLFLAISDDPVMASGLGRLSISSAVGATSAREPPVRSAQPR